MIKNRHTFIRFLVLILLFLFPIETQSWDPRPTTVKLGLFAAVLCCLSICEFKPSLYEKSQKSYLLLAEERINALKFVLEHPTEEQLLPFKYELACYYKEVLKKRGIFSKIFFESHIPQQIWALVDEEIKQHLQELYSAKSLLSNKVFVQSEDTKPILDKIEKLQDILVSIQDHFRLYTSYQSECSLARQEHYIYTATQLVTAIFFYYLVDQNINSLYRSPNLFEPFEKN